MTHVKEKNCMQSRPKSCRPNRKTTVSNVTAFLYYHYFARTFK